MGSVLTSLFYTDERTWSYPAIKAEVAEVT